MPAKDRASKARAKAKSKSKSDDAEEVGAIIAGAGMGEGLTAEQQRVAARRAVTGNLSSPDQSLDIKIDAFSMQVAGNQLVTDCNLEFTQGCRYGLIGDNGSGKSNVLAAIAQGEVPLPSHCDVFHLHEEAPPTEQTAVEAVIAHLRDQAERLEELSARLLEEDPSDERLEIISARLEELDPDGSEPRARKILSGLGFSDRMVPMDRMTKHMSGGWRMRVSLAKALFAAPSLLLLDEPTNHLDLEACIWLEDHLSRYNKCLFVISHSQDFLNSVCTHTVWLDRLQLTTYGGNYATFCQLVSGEEQVQMKLFQKQQDDIEKLSTFVRVNKANGVAQSAKSKKKVLEKVQDEAVEKPNQRQETLTFQFTDCTKLEPPVLPFDGVSFSYSGEKKDYLYEKLDLAVDCDSRIALVGPNGCGKSTLIKLMSGELAPCEGSVKAHQHLMLGKFHQHSQDILDPDASPLAFLKKTFPPPEYKMSEEMWRSYLAMFGFSSKQMTTAIGMLSDGQKSRLIFALIAKKPHNLLLLDEPTNHLDVSSVDSLAQAIKGFQGGLVLVSHDFRLIDQVANEIWVCEKKGVRKYDGNIASYKAELAKQVAKHRV